MVAKVQKRAKDRAPLTLSKKDEDEDRSEKARADFHKHPLYYPVRNHIIDFLVTRSRAFARDGFDPRNVAIVRPALVPELT